MNNDINQFEEILKIKNVSGVHYLKWFNKDATKLCASSFTLDFTAPIWDLSNQYRPEMIIKGHSDVVTSFAIDPTNKYIITGSKDWNLIWQELEESFMPFRKSNKCSLTFTTENDVVFRSEYLANLDKIVRNTNV